MRTPEQQEAHLTYNAEWNRQHSHVRAKRYLNRDRARRNDTTIEQVEAVIAAAQGLCMLGCGRPAACLDHDHLTGKLRGYLCRQCNLGLGYFQDNLSVLKKAIAYLEESCL